MSCHFVLPLWNIFLSCNKLNVVFLVLLPLYLPLVNYKPFPIKHSSVYRGVWAKWNPLLETRRENIGLNSGIRDNKFQVKKVGMTTRGNVEGFSQCDCQCVDWQISDSVSLDISVTDEQVQHLIVMSHSDECMSAQARTFSVWLLVFNHFYLSKCKQKQTLERKARGRHDYPSVRHTSCACIMERQCTIQLQSHHVMLRCVTAVLL